MFFLFKLSGVSPITVHYNCNAPRDLAGFQDTYKKLLVPLHLYLIIKLLL